VDLPAPFGPTSAVRVPGLISTDTLFKAGLLFSVYANVKFSATKVAIN